MRSVRNENAANEFRQKGLHARKDGTQYQRSGPRLLTEAIKNPQSVPETEKRASQRDPARDLSEIILDGRKAGIACLVHDLSEHGARLEVSIGDLPNRFILANHTKRTKTLCRLVWRDNRMLGVKFLTRPRNFTLKDGI